MMNIGINDEDDGVSGGDEDSSHLAVEQQMAAEAMSTQKTPQHIIQLNASSPILKYDRLKMSARESHRYRCLHFIDLTLTAFVFAPLAICNWATTWDIAYLYIFNDSTQFFYSIMFTFVSSNIIILFTYIYQYELQDLHNFFEEKRTTRSGLSAHYVNYRQHNHMQQRESLLDRWLSADFVFRSVYTYVITTAYVLQWRTYWDLLNHSANRLDWSYSAFLAVFALLIHRYVMKRSIGSFAKTAPFYLAKDANFDKYFLQTNVFNFPNKSLSNALEFVYNEIIQVLIATFIWKGMWDMWDHVATMTASFGRLFSAPVADPAELNTSDMSPVSSLLATSSSSVIAPCLIGYTMFYALIYVQYCYLDSARFQRHSRTFRTLTMDVFYACAFLSLSCIWYTVWTTFDNFALDSEYRNLIVVTTHFATVFILCGLGLSTVLYGPAGSDIDLSNYDNADVTQLKNTFVFKVSYFT